MSETNEKLQRQLSSIRAPVTVVERPKTSVKYAPITSESKGKNGKIKKSVVDIIASVTTGPNQPRVQTVEIPIPEPEDNQEIINEILGEDEPTEDQLYRRTLFEINRGIDDTREDREELREKVSKNIISEYEYQQEEERLEAKRKRKEKKENPEFQREDREKEQEAKAYKKRNKLLFGTRAPAPYVAPNSVKGVEGKGKDEEELRENFKKIRRGLPPDPSDSDYKSYYDDDVTFATFLALALKKYDIKYLDDENKKFINRLYNRLDPKEYRSYQLLSLLKPTEREDMLSAKVKLTWGKRGLIQKVMALPVELQDSFLDYYIQSGHGYTESYNRWYDNRETMEAVERYFDDQETQGNVAETTNIDKELDLLRRRLLKYLDSKGVVLSPEIKNMEYDKLLMRLPPDLDKIAIHNHISQDFNYLGSLFFSREVIKNGKVILLDDYTFAENSEFLSDKKGGNTERALTNDERKIRSQISRLNKRIIGFLKSRVPPEDQEYYLEMKREQLIEQLSKNTLDEIENDLPDFSDGVLRVLALRDNQDKFVNLPTDVLSVIGYETYSGLQAGVNITKDIRKKLSDIFGIDTSGIDNSKLEELYQEKLSIKNSREKIENFNLMKWLEEKNANISQDSTNDEKLEVIKNYYLSLPDKKRSEFILDINRARSNQKLIDGSAIGLTVKQTEILNEKIARLKKKNKSYILESTETKEVHSERLTIVNWLKLNATEEEKERFDFDNLTLYEAEKMYAEKLETGQIKPLKTFQFQPISDRELVKPQIFSNVTKRPIIPEREVDFNMRELERTLKEQVFLAPTREEKYIESVLRNMKESWESVNWDTEKFVEKAKEHLTREYTLSFKAMGPDGKIIENAFLTNLFRRPGKVTGRRQIRDYKIKVLLSLSKYYFSRLNENQTVVVKVSNESRMSKEIDDRAVQLGEEFLSLFLQVICGENQEYKRDSDWIKIAVLSLLLKCEETNDSSIGKFIGELSALTAFISQNRSSPQRKLLCSVKIAPSSLFYMSDYDPGEPPSEEDTALFNAVKAEVYSSLLTAYVTPGRIEPESLWKNPGRIELGEKKYLCTNPDGEAIPESKRFLYYNKHGDVFCFDVDKLYELLNSGENPVNPHTQEPFEKEFVNKIRTLIRDKDRTIQQYYDNFGSKMIRYRKEESYNLKDLYDSFYKHSFLIPEVVEDKRVFTDKRFNRDFIGNVKKVYRLYFNYMKSLEKPVVPDIKGMGKNLPIIPNLWGLIQDSLKKYRNTPVFIQEQEQELEQKSTRIVKKVEEEEEDIMGQLLTEDTSSSEEEDDKQVDQTEQEQNKSLPPPSSPKEEEEDIMGKLLEETEQEKPKNTVTMNFSDKKRESIDTSTSCSGCKDRLKDTVYKSVKINKGTPQVVKFCSLDCMENYEF